ncbi:hypothetical protein LNKW23_21490 [Paralimibaculum aggregatum]|uniref:TadE-like domain-containing protein n=1 Tax=Paralimibaculum aggregatum TaxID=3036245 RepID=A0ABQ6LI17_9RHOB|nr:TadE/TadG family type IV pilus assembly protein [Limibaculum sp. NKW23]GMG82936.1 hypothetical protein LNKW23_21490 [Limibaculum sp. NKW23]
MDAVHGDLTKSTGSSGFMGRFLADERGAITTDIVLILFPILLIILTIFEIGISFYFVLAAQKAAQMGARFIIGETPIHSGVPDVYEVALANGEFGDSCYRVDGAATPCTYDTSSMVVVGTDGDGNNINGWMCDGDNLGASCDETRFNELVDEMRWVYPSLLASHVEVIYTDEELGFAGGPFHPKVEVAIEARSSPIKILSLLDFVWGLVPNNTELGDDEKVAISRGQTPDSQKLRRVAASVFGGDNNSTNVRN